MIRPGFLDRASRQDLIELARNGSAAHRLARRANALVLLDDGMSCEAIAKVLLLDDDTIRTWYRLYEEDGIEGLTNFSYEGSACQLSGEQQEKLKTWVAAALPRTTRQVGAWIENEFGVVYEGRSGLIALLHRLGLEYHKPNVIPRKLDEEKQKAFIESYEKLLNSLGDDEAVLFADAVHPTHAARPVGCWAPSQEKLAIEQTSGRQRINIHGAIDLETGQTRMIEALTIDAASTIRLLQSIEASGQCALSSCQAGAGMARPARAPDQTALHPGGLTELGNVDLPDTQIRALRGFDFSFLTFGKTMPFFGNILPRDCHYTLDGDDLTTVRSENVTNVDSCIG